MSGEMVRLCTVILALLAMGLSGLLACEISRRLGPTRPVNEFAGLTLPDPNDPRWRQHAREPLKLVLGEVTVHTVNGFVFISGLDVDEVCLRGIGPVRRYATAVTKGFMQNRAFEAVLDDGPAPRVRMLP